MSNINKREKRKNQRALKRALRAFAGFLAADNGVPSPAPAPTPKAPKAKPAPAPAAPAPAAPAPAPEAPKAAPAPWVLKPIESGVYSADKEIRAHLKQFWESRGRKVEIVAPLTAAELKERATKREAERIAQRETKRASIEAFLAQREAKAKAEAEAWAKADAEAWAKVAQRNAQREARELEAAAKRRIELAERIERETAKREERKAKREERKAAGVNKDWRTPEQRRESKANIRRFIAARRLMKTQGLAFNEAKSLVNTTDTAIVDAQWREACALAPAPELAPEPAPTKAPKAPKKWRTKQAYIEAHRRAKKATSQQQLAAKLGLIVITEAQALEIMEKN